jgi:hypothetical protein
MSDITDKLCALMSMGYRFLHPRNADGNVVAVTGIRVHHDVIDVVQLYGEDDANAVRMSGSEPDVLSPKSVLWRTSGTPDAVIADLLHLAEPVTAAPEPPADGAHTGCWVATRPGRATWLPTSA